MKVLLRDFIVAVLVHVLMTLGGRKSVPDVMKVGPKTERYLIMKNATQLRSEYHEITV